MKEKITASFVFYLYLFAVLMLVVVGLVPAISIKNSDVQSKENYIDLADGWTDSDGEPVNLDSLSELCGENEKTCVIYYTLPQDLLGTTQFCFRTRNVYVRLELDGRLIHQTSVTRHRFFNQSPGTNWNVVNLFESAEGKQLKMAVSLAYADSSSRIDQVYLGNGADILRHITGKKMVPLLIGFSMMLIGILFIYSDFPFNSGNKKNHSLLYLGCFAFMTGLWCAVETNLLQFYGGSGQTVQLMADILLKLLAIPMLLFVAEHYNRKKSRLLLGICGMGLLDITVSLVLHLAGIWDFHRSLAFTHIVLGISLFYVACTIFTELIHQKKRHVEEKHMRDTVLNQIGVLVIVVSAMVDVIRYYVSPGTDLAATIRIGLLVFILCYGISSMNMMIAMVKEGMQVEVIHKLAYLDGLTGIGNRTAYMRKVAEISTEGKAEQLKTGIVMLDVNNLKKVNDNLGHHVGDEMLIRAAGIIDNTFGKRGHVYRIGGDEFVVLITAENPGNVYEHALAQFLREIEEYNSNPDKKYTLSIAYGYAEPEEGNEACSVDYEKLQNLADHLMYEKKKRMKDMQEK